MRQSLDLCVPTCAHTSFHCGFSQSLSSTSEGQVLWRKVAPCLMRVYKLWYVVWRGSSNRLSSVLRLKKNLSPKCQDVQDILIQVMRIKSGDLCPSSVLVPTVIIQLHPVSPQMSCSWQQHAAVWRVQVRRTQKTEKNRNKPFRIFSTHCSWFPDAPITSYHIISHQTLEALSSLQASPDLFLHLSLVTETSNFHGIPWRSMALYKLIMANPMANISEACDNAATFWRHNSHQRLLRAMASSSSMSQKPPALMALLQAGSGQRLELPEHFSTWFLKHVHQHFDLSFQSFTAQHKQDQTSGSAMCLQ